MFDRIKKFLSTKESWEKRKAKREEVRPINPRKDAKKERREARLELKRDRRRNRYSGQVRRTIRAIENRRRGGYIPPDVALDELTNCETKLIGLDQIGRRIRAVAKRRRMRGISDESRRKNRRKW